MRKAAFPKVFERIIVFRTDRMGDLILSFPVIEALRAAYPNAQIDVLVNPAIAPLAGLQPNIHRVWVDTFFGIRGFLFLLHWLRERSYDLAVHLYPRPRFAIACFLASIPVRIGTLYRYYSLLFNIRVPLHRKRSGMHERDLNLHLLKALSIPIANVDTGIRVPEEARTEVLRLMQHNGFDPRKPWIVLHPGSGGSSLNWPAEYFGRLAQMLIRKGFQVVVTGTHQDQADVDTVVSCGDGSIINLCGRLDLLHLAALLAQANFLVSNSTGPLHLADALGTRVIGLYSPIESALPDRWGPYHQQENVLVPTRPICTRCSSVRCREYNCMSTILPEAVLLKILEIKPRCS